MVNRLDYSARCIFKYKRIFYFWGLLALLILINGNAFAQTDTEFWFSIPETNRYHNVPNPTCPTHGTDGKDVWFKFTSMELESTIQILRPGYPEGQRLLHEFTMGPNSFEEIHVGQWVNDGPTTMENRLKYTESDLPAGGYDFINRSNKGIQIRATTPVTVYYEISLPYNKDLLSLKGRNALGKKFYVPFQNRYNNSDQYACDERQYNSFDIVATDDATVRITTPFAVFVWPNGIQAAGTFTINLAKGQTAIIAPYLNTAQNYDVNRAANGRLTGSLVEVISGGDIAVITKDDLVRSSSSVDYVADQLVPIEHIGTDYVVMKGKLTGNDYAYVVATEDNTRIYVDEVFVATINKGKTHEVTLTNFSTAIRSSKIGVDGETANKPVYVYHLSGYGAQFAGALIPTISTCTGSSQVAFSRSTGGTFGFDLNIMARVEALGHFVLTEDGVDVTATLGTTLGINNPANFSDPSGTYHPDPAYDPDSLYSEQWQVAQFNANALTEGKAYMLKNTRDVFHLGVLNGDGGADAFYGYFSNFNTFAPKGIVVSTGFAGEALCAGESRQLYASGGTWYQWERADGLLPHYLDKTDIPNPIAGPLVESVIYNVDIGGACGLSQVEKVELLVGDAYAEIEVVGDNFACVDITREHTFTLRSNSTGDYRRTWEWRIAGSTEWNPSNRIFGDDGMADDAREVDITLENNTGDPIQYELRLVVSDFEISCNRTATVFLMVYPYLDINPSRSLVPPTNCEPLEVNFFANPLGEYSSASFFWDFKDGNTAATQNPSNLYLNKTNSSVSYIPTLTVSNWGDVCSVTKPVPQITVQPFVKAEFTAKPSEGCSPLRITDFANNSRGGISSYSWTLTRMHDNVIVGTSNDDDPTDDFDIQTISSVLVNNRTDNTQEIYRLRLVVQNAGGCQDIFDQMFHVSPNPRVTGINVTPTSNPNCSPLDLDYEATGLQNVTWMDWKVSGSSIGSTASGSHTLYNDGAVSVVKIFSFEASNSWGCSITPLTTDVTVQPFVEASFTLSTQEGCTPLAVTFTNNSSGGSSIFEWNVDGTTYANAAAIPASFTNNNVDNTVRTIPVTLTARNSAGCEHTTDVRNIIVYPRATASFTASFEDALGNSIAPGDALCAPVTGDFTGTYQNATIYTWNFGELGDRTVANPQDVVFPNTTTANKPYPVTLVANNTFNCPSSPVTNTYTVHPEVKANFDIATVASCVSATNPFNLEVSAPSIANVSYSWSFNTQTRTGTNPTFTAITENKSGVNQTYPIVLTATGLGGCTAVNSSKSVTIYPEVQARWTGDLTERCAPADINLTNNSNLFAAASPSVTNIHWQVFDGATMVNSSSAQSFTPSLPNTSHTAQKTYDIKLTATSAYGCVGEHDGIITVNPNPLARFNASVTEECTPLVLDVVNESVTTATSTYTWSWDGGSANDENANPIEVTYNNNTEIVDPKHINLHIENEYGCVSDYDYLFEVFPQVIANLSITRLAQNENCGDEEFTFTNTSTAGSSIHYYEWTFGTDKWVTSSTADFNRSFTAHGTNPLDIPVSVRAYSTIGCTNVTPAEETIYIFPRVVAAQSFTIGDICDGDVDLTLTNASSNVGTTHVDANTNFLWTFKPSPLDDGVLTTSSGGIVNLVNNSDNNLVVYDVDFVAETEWDYKGINRTCSAKIAGNSVTVYPNVIANFELSSFEGCNPLTVEFTNNSTGVLPGEGGTFEWKLGDSTGSVDSEPADKVYTHRNKNQSVEYPIELIVTNPLGCSKTISKTVTVYPWVESSFAVDRIEGCTPLNVTLNNTSVSSTYTYQWNFAGNGSTVSTAASTAAQPGVITFTNPLGAGDVLSIQNPVIDLVTSLNTSVYTVGGGCAKSATQAVSVFPHVYPNFDADLEGCHPLNINFTNTSNVFGGTGNGKYTWDLGIGVTTNNQSPTQEYQNSSLVANQSYNGRLTAVSDHGCTDFIPFTVTVWPKPQALIELTEYMECSPFNLEIINQSIGKNRGSTLEFTYDYGDGSPVVGPTTNDGNLPHEFRNFNDYIESYTMSLYVETEDGCDDITYQTIQVFPEVTSIFDTDDGNHALCNPFEVDFVNSSRNAWRYYWDFDDGGITSSSFAPSYRFVNSGTEDRVFDVSLTVMSEYDCEHTEILPLTVYAAPIADFAIIPPHQVFPQDGTLPSFEFRNQSRPGGMPATWAHSWTFGDGYTSTSMEPSVEHTYEHWGFRDDDFRYEVTLSIENERCSDFVAQKLTLLPPEPISIFRADNYRSCSPLVIKFFNDSKFYLTDRQATAFEWRLNNADEPFSTEFEPTLTITEPGYYNIGLRVYGDGGEKNYYRTFRVFENPVARFEVMPERVLLPNAKVHFFNLSENANKYVWDFGDGTPKSSEKDPVHIYDELGEYRVSLMAFAEYEHKDDDGNLLIHECIDYDSRFPAVWVEGEGKILFPNAFMPSKLGPNGGYYDEVDYKNEVFHPVADGVIEYRLMIFNRWGEQIFESNDIKIGWDGYYKGKLANQDVYVWRAVGKFSNGELFDVRGNVTLLR